MTSPTYSEVSKMIADARREDPGLFMYSTEAREFVHECVDAARKAWEDANAQYVRRGAPEVPCPRTASWAADQVAYRAADIYGIAAPDVLRDLGLIDAFDVAKIMHLRERSAFEGAKVAYLPMRAKAECMYQIRYSMRSRHPRRA